MTIDDHSSRIVKLDVGGKIFKTSISTLTKHDSMLKRMFNSDIPAVKNEEGCVFIDRDSQHFRLILNFLRDGQMALPDSEREVKEVLAEARYFLLDPLIELCEERLETSVSPYYHVVSTVLEARKYIFSTEKPVVVLRLPVYIATNGSQCYYFSEEKFREVAEQHYKSVSFVLVTEPEFTEDCSWSFFLKYKKITARIKGPEDNALLEDCFSQLLEDAKERRRNSSLSE
uniref:BTB domain-containing protein n=1 Tax=Caenorhabditis tropicalis TaxID=1561998 RepID=A0A1I7TME8_9PELO